MKTNALLAFFFFAALIAFTTAELVYDSDGELLKNRGNYYLLQPGLGGRAIKGAGIGNGDGSCSLAVVLQGLFKKGWLTNIASPYLALLITTDDPIWISFVDLPSVPCTKKPKWLVTRESGFGDPVMVGDSKEFPNRLSGRFFIKTYDSAKHHYKLVFCFEQAKCGHVGVKTDSHGNKRLIVTEDEKVEPLVFKFVKETSGVASDISMVV